jgi:hypothetical protein
VHYAAGTCPHSIPACRDAKRQAHILAFGYLLLTMTISMSGCCFTRGSQSITSPGFTTVAHKCCCRAPVVTGMMPTPASATLQSSHRLHDYASHSRRNASTPAPPIPLPHSWRCPLTTTPSERADQGPVMP